MKKAPLSNSLPKNFSFEEEKKTIFFLSENDSFRHQVSLKILKKLSFQRKFLKRIP